MSRGKKPFPRTTPAEKHCPKCDQTRPADQFWKSSRSHDGLQSWCKPCASAYNAVLMAIRRRKPEAA